MLWTRYLVQCDFPPMVAMQQHSAVMLDRMVSEWASGSKPGFAGLVRRTRFPLMDRRARQNLTMVEVTAVLQVMRMESSMTLAGESGVSWTISLRWTLV